MIPLAPPTKQTPTEDNDSAITKKEDIYFEYFKNSTVKIYPNPTYGKLKIELESKLTDIASSIVIYNLEGKQVYKKENISNSNVINLSSQPKGTYILKIMVGESVRQWKIVKM